MRISRLLSASFFLVAFSTAAIAQDAVKVEKEMQVNGAVEAVWEKVGGFCAIADWHPAMAKCEETEEGDAKFRILTLGDGATIKEKNNGETDNSYSYAITESPLPVKDYTADFSIAADGDASKITWTASFQAEGATPEEAQKVIEGIFDAGLNSIRDQFAK